MSIYNSNGEKIEKLFDKYHYAGEYEIEFNARSFPTGIYYYSLESENIKRTKSMILVK